MEARVRKEAKRTRKKEISPDGLTEARAYHPPGVATPRGSG